jgi:hypothetical protein
MRCACPEAEQTQNTGAAAEINDVISRSDASCYRGPITVKPYLIGDETEVLV